MKRSVSSNMLLLRYYESNVDRQIKVIFKNDKRIVKGEQKLAKEVAKECTLSTS